MNDLQLSSYKELYMKESIDLDRYPDIDAKFFKDREFAINEAAGELGKRFAEVCGKLGIQYNAMYEDIKITANTISDILKREGLSNNSKRKIYKIADDFWNKMNVDLDIGIAISNNKQLSGLDPDKVSKSIRLLLFLMIVQLLIQTILIIIDPMGILTITIVAPVTEENAKMIAIKGGFIKEFTIVFNLFEFSGYVLRGAPIIGRLAAVGLHLTTTTIQFLMRNTEILDKLNIEEQNNRLKAQMTGHMIGVLIHALWNTTAIIVAIAGM